MPCSDDSAGRDGLNQGFPRRDIGRLAGRQDQTNGVAKSIDTSMNLGGQPTSFSFDG
jgi:hypothetical protein